MRLFQTFTQSIILGKTSGSIYCSPVMIILGTLETSSLSLFFFKNVCAAKRQSCILPLFTQVFCETGSWQLLELMSALFSEFSYKRHIWMVYVTQDISAWILVVVSLERLALVWYPHITKSICTRTTAIPILVSVVGAVMLINSHIMYGIGDVLKNENNQTTLLQCFFQREDYQRFYVSIWPWIDLAKFYAIPFFNKFCSVIFVFFQIFIKEIKNQTQRTINSG